jgi:multisubunit Na+/H+ antiporter MnhE subunit
MRTVRWWLIGILVWLVLAATLARPDVIAAGAAGALVALAAWLPVRAGLVDYRLRWRWLVHLPRLPLQVAHDLVLLAKVLVRPSTAAPRFRAVPYDGGGDEPEAVGRRALLTLAASLGPNTFIVGFDREHETVLVHQLVPDEHVLPLPDGKFPPS